MYLYCFVMSIVVERMVEVEMVWMFDSDQCALGHCVGSGGGCDAVVVAACVYKKTCVFIAFSRLSCNPTVSCSIPRMFSLRFHV